MPARLLTLDEVADELALSTSQVYALVRHRDLPAVKLGGRGHWRVDRQRLERWLDERHDDTAAWIDQHPFTGHPPDTQPVT